MTNKEFYEKLLEYQSQKKLVFCPPKNSKTRFFNIKIGTKLVRFHTDIADFADEMEAKAKSKDFFTQKTLERLLNVSRSKINTLVDENKYIRIIVSKNTNFYIKKDW